MSHCELFGSNQMEFGSPNSNKYKFIYLFSNFIETKIEVLNLLSFKNKNIMTCSQSCRYYPLWT